MQKNNQIKFLLIGGHSTPAFAVLDELIKQGYSNFTWVGEKHNQKGNRNTSAEYKTVKEKYKINFLNLKAGKLVRKWTMQTWANGLIQFIYLIWGFYKSFSILIRTRPNVIVSFGGFKALPIVIIAKLFFWKTLIVTHEQTIVTGLANKIISKFAHKVFISWEESLKFFPKNKTIWTGNPIREQILIPVQNKIISNMPIIFITAGNQGSMEINKRVFEAVPELIKKYKIIHQTGNSTVTKDFEKAKNLKESLVQNSDNYTFNDFFPVEEMSRVLQSATLVIARGGANTILELLALGKPSIITPIPWVSHDEQTKNAKVLEKLGIGKIIKQDDSFTSIKLTQTIDFCITQIKNNTDFNSNSLEVAKENAKLTVKLGAASIIVGEIENQLN
jgi:UDP-N-acetylglucosamine--N-acetylmuramyl-(pentapeptide) pyrophosphoryl-undecaprenol N-acetylglucosamine transferase